MIAQCTQLLCRGVACLALAFLVACTSTKPVTAPGITESVVRGSTVLLLRLDIECSEVAVGGTSARPEWSAKAQASVGRALTDFMQEHSTRLVNYDDTSFPPERRAEQAAAIAALTGVLPAPTGPAPGTLLQVEQPTPDLLAPLREDFAADYALSVSLQESFQSAGHMALRYGLAALLGPAGAIVAPTQGPLAPPRTGQFGYARLVDLRTGDMVWSNTITTIGEVPTDIRDPEKARDAVDRLMKALPVGN